MSRSFAPVHGQPSAPAPAVLVADAEGRVIEWSPALPALLDLPDGRIRPGMAARDLFHGLTWASGAHGSGTLRTAAGRVVAVTRTDLPLSGQAHFIFTAAASAVPWKYARLEVALENIGQGLTVFDRSGALVFANRRFREFYGIREGALHPGMSVREVISLATTIDPETAGNGRPLYETVAAVIARGERCVSERRTRDGRVIEVAFEPLDDGSMVITFTDITEREHRAAELKATRDAAQAASKAKSAFLASMSHELRTPLNAIIGFSEIIKEEMMGPVGNASYKAYAGDIHSSGQHLLSLINDILDLSKIEAGKFDLRDERVDIAAAARSGVVIVSSLADKNSVTLMNRVTQDIPAVRADARAFKQILINLLSNAVKFTPPGGRVVVEARVDATKGLGVSVRDTGIGMSEEEQVKVFEPFYQVDSDLNRKYEGTGLGLPLVKGLMEEHGGTVEIDSMLNVGTTVTVWFPPDRLVR